MTTYVALLRGINLGARNRLPMTVLRELVTALDGRDPRTLSQSGNVVFEHADARPAVLVDRLERLIAEECGLRVPCLVRELADLRRVIDRNPFAGTAFEPARFVVCFLSDVPEPRSLADVDPAAYAPDEFRLGEREVYLNCPTGLARAKLPIIVGDKLSHLVGTARNWNTVTKLAAWADN